MRVSHDLALLDLTILLKHLGDLSLRQTRMDTSDKEVGAGVNGTIVILLRGGCVLDVAAFQVNSATTRQEVVVRLTYQGFQRETGIGDDCLRRRAPDEEKRFCCHARNEEARLMKFMKR